MSAETFEFKCPSCDGVCNLPVKEIGQFIPCPLCGNSIAVTGPEPPPLRQMSAEIAFEPATGDAIDSGSRCYACHRIETRVCQRCGRFFCNEHKSVLRSNQCARCPSAVGVIALIGVAAIVLFLLGGSFITSFSTGFVDIKGMSANVSVLSVQPSPGSAVNATTVLDALVEYNIVGFDSSAEYYLGTLFYATNNLETFSSSYNSFADLSRIQTQSGSIRINYPILKEWESGKLAKPVRVVFYVMVRTAANRTSVIGMSESIVYPAH